jgi:outer membrane murein-binding lipoprotein Lpp
MGDIRTFNAKVDDLRDIVTAVAIEIKTAEGKIVGLREDVDALGATQRELKVRIVALEAGLSELSTFVDTLSARLAVTNADLGMLREEFDALIADYAVFKDAFAAFQVSVYGDIDALRDSVYTDLDLLRTEFFGNIDELGTTIYGEISGLQTGVYGELDGFKSDVYGQFTALKDGFSADISVVYGQLTALKDGFSADISMLSMTVDDLSLRVQALENEDVGTFKKKVIDMERNMAALAIRIDNNRAKLEGFDHAVAGLSDEMAATRESVITANQELLAEYDGRLLALESVDIQSQIDSLYFISIVALLAGVGALIWGFLGNN